MKKIPLFFDVLSCVGTFKKRFIHKKREKLNSPPFWFISQILYFSATSIYLTTEVVLLRVRRTRSYRAGHSTPYFVLHQIGFVLPLTSLLMRCALTTPFHPYQHRYWRFIFCDTSHPSLRSSLTFVRNLALWCPDFPL